jgi:protein TonB
MEKIMFRETLLESSPVRRKSKRWPMATAFTVELVAGAFLVVLPLLYSGVLPVSAQPPLYAPISSVQVERAQPNNNSHGGGGPHDGNQRPSVASFDFQHQSAACLTCTECAAPTCASSDAGPGPDLGVGGGGPSIPWLPPVRYDPVKFERVKRSHLDEALLINKVEPIYPKFALMAGIRGEVRLHAIIAKDGTIQSISVVSGHPLLASAALEAVRQWRYRPYLLNKEAVEVETFITVNFKGVR